VDTLMNRGSLLIKYNVFFFL